MYPHLNPIIAAAVEAGASAAYLSGAGPTVMAITSGVRSYLLHFEIYLSLIISILTAFFVKKGFWGYIHTTSSGESGHESSRSDACRRRAVQHPRSGLHHATCGESFNLSVLSL